MPKPPPGTACPPLQAMATAAQDPDTLFQALNHTDSPAFHHDYARGFGTLHTLVCHPETRTALIGIGPNNPPLRIDLQAWARGQPLATSLLQGQTDTNPAPRFVGRNLAGAKFQNVSLAAAHFDDIDSTAAEITAHCNFKQMRIAGVLVEDLFAAYRRSKAEDESQS